MRRTDILKMGTSEILAATPATESKEKKELTMEEKLTPVAMLSDALTMFAIGMNFHHHASMCSHKIGLQGFKRMHEYYSRMDEDYLIDLQHYCIDVFGEMVMPDWSKVHSHECIDSPDEMLENWYTHETEKYNCLNDIIMDLCEAGYAYESSLLTKALKGVTREIEKSKRHMQDFAKSDWSWHHMRMIDMYLHDKYKEKEKYIEKHKLHC